jgi:hypothetical protein
VGQLICCDILMKRKAMPRSVSDFSTFSSLKKGIKIKEL